MAVIGTPAGKTLLANVSVADTFARRTKGLLGADALDADTALLIPNCRAVHTLGMRFAIDVIFLDGGFKVIRIVPNLGAGRLAVCARFGTMHALEARAGRAAELALAAGQALQLREC